MAGGTPLEFNTFHVTDSEAFAARSMRYVLPSRDVVADSIELMAEGHGVDGLVLLTGGDKPTPGMVMAAARLDLPSILLYAGPTVHGMHRGKKLFLETVYDGVGEVVRGEIDEATLQALGGPALPGPRRRGHPHLGQHGRHLHRGARPVAARHRGPCPPARTSSCGQPSTPACARSS